MNAGEVLLMWLRFGMARIPASEVS